MMTQKQINGLKTTLWTKMWSDIHSQIDVLLWRGIRVQMFEKLEDQGINLTETIAVHIKNET
jgi:hypothetical protein